MGKNNFIFFSFYFFLTNDFFKVLVFFHFVAFLKMFKNQFHSIFIFDKRELSNCFIFRKISFTNTNENKSTYFIILDDENE